MAFSDERVVESKVRLVGAMPSESRENACLSLMGDAMSALVTARQATTLTEMENGTSRQIRH